MKNITTPRTLADAQFVTGYRNAIKRTGTLADRLMLWFACATVGGWALLHIASLIGGTNAG